MMGLQVLVPTGTAFDSDKFPNARRLTDLNGKTLGEISNRLWSADRIFPVIRQALVRQFPSIKFVPYTKFPSGADQIMDNTDLAERVLEKGCDAVIGASAG